MPPATQTPDSALEESREARMLVELAGEDPEIWFRTCATLFDKDGIKQDRPKPNVVQRRVFDYYRKCQIAGEPCLMLILKPRQVGASTGTQAVLYHHQRKYGDLNGSLMGDIEPTSVKVFRIYRTFAEHDRYPWRDGRTLAKDKNQAEAVELPSGSRYSMETAGSKNAGRSGTVQVINMTEAAHYHDSSRSDPVLAYLNSFHDKSVRSLGIVDSTPNGPQGWFYKQCMAALAGRGRWKLIFAAWFEFPEHSMTFSDDRERQAFERGLEDHEKEEVSKHPEITLEQLKWRRDTIENKCGGSVDKFRQEYPSDERECFELSSRKRFNVSKLSKMRERARMVHPETGDFHLQQDDAAVWVSDESGLCRRYEDARYGLSYLVSWDSCTGADQQDSGDPDYHSIGVIRKGYFDDRRDKYFFPRLAALYHSREEIEVAALMAAAMSRYYGGCMVVPEVNNCGLAGVKKLVEMEVPVFERVARNSADGTDMRQYGWRTDRVSRKTMIDNLAGIVRRDEIDIDDGPVIDELMNFIVDKHGVSKAMFGWHDDHVMMLAIAMENIQAAREHKRPRRPVYSPRQLRRNPTLMCPDGWRRG